MEKECSSSNNNYLYWGNELLFILITPSKANFIFTNTSNNNIILYIICSRVLTWKWHSSYREHEASSWPHRSPYRSQSASSVCMPWPTSLISTYCCLDTASPSSCLTKWRPSLPTLSPSTASSSPSPCSSSTSASSPTHSPTSTTLSMSSYITLSRSFPPWSSSSSWPWSSSSQSGPPSTSASTLPTRRAWTRSTQRRSSTSSRTRTTITRWPSSRQPPPCSQAEEAPPTRPEAPAGQRAERGRRGHPPEWRGCIWQWARRWSCPRWSPAPPSCWAWWGRPCWMTCFSSRWSTPPCSWGSCCPWLHPAWTWWWRAAGWGLRPPSPSWAASSCAPLAGLPPGCSPCGSSTHWRTSSRRGLWSSPPSSSLRSTAGCLCCSMSRSLNRWNPCLSCASSSWSSPTHRTNCS